MIGDRRTDASEESARAVALTALAHIIADDSFSNRFLSVTGMGGAELAAYVDDASFLGGVLDFVLEDESLLLNVAQGADLRPEEIARARRSLPGAFIER
jgi:hypothetical protein